MCSPSKETEPTHDLSSGKSPRILKLISLISLVVRPAHLGNKEGHLASPTDKRPRGRTGRRRFLRLFFPSVVARIRLAAIFLRCLFRPSFDDWPAAAAAAQKVSPITRIYLGGSTRSRAPCAQEPEVARYPRNRLSRKNRLSLFRVSSAGLLGLGSSSASDKDDAAKCTFG